MKEIIVDNFAGGGGASNNHKAESRVTFYDREVKVTPMLVARYDLQTK